VFGVIGGRHVRMDVQVEPVAAGAAADLDVGERLGLLADRGHFVVGDADALGMIDKSVKIKTNPPTGTIHPIPPRRADGLGEVIVRPVDPVVIPDRVAVGVLGNADVPPRIDAVGEPALIERFAGDREDLGFHLGRPAAEQIGGQSLMVGEELLERAEDGVHRAVNLHTRGTGAGRATGRRQDGDGKRGDRRGHV
jgi:hypothetical protein